MFESLTASLSSAINALRGRGKLTDANMREGLSGVRTALLEVCGEPLQLFVHDRLHVHGVLVAGGVLFFFVAFGGLGFGL